MNAETVPLAAALWTKPVGMNHKPICRQPVNYQYIHHHHLLLLFSPKAATQFSIPWRVEGCVNLDGWPHRLSRWSTCPQTVSHPSSSWVLGLLALSWTDSVHTSGRTQFVRHILSTVEVCDRQPSRPCGLWSCSRIGAGPSFVHFVRRRLGCTDWEAWPVPTSLC